MGGNERPATDSPGVSDKCPKCGKYNYGRRREFCSTCHYQGPAAGLSELLIRTFVCRIWGHKETETETGDPYCRRCNRSLHTGSEQ